MFSHVLGYEAVSCIEFFPKLRMIVVLYLKGGRSPKKEYRFCQF